MAIAAEDRGGYGLFRMDQRRKILATNPDMRFVRAGLFVGKAWEALSHAERKSWSAGAALTKIK